MRESASSKVQRRRITSLMATCKQIFGGTEKYIIIYIIISSIFNSYNAQSNVPSTFDCPTIFGFYRMDRILSNGSAVVAFISDLQGNSYLVTESKSNYSNFITTSTCRGQFTSVDGNQTSANNEFLYTKASCVLDLFLSNGTQISMKKISCNKHCASIDGLFRADDDGEDRDIYIGIAAIDEKNVSLVFSKSSGHGIKIDSCNYFILFQESEQRTSEIVFEYHEETCQLFSFNGVGKGSSFFLNFTKMNCKSGCLDMAGKYGSGAIISVNGNSVFGQFPGSSRANFSGSFTTLCKGTIFFSGNISVDFKYKETTCTLSFEGTTATENDWVKDGACGSISDCPSIVGLYEDFRESKPDVLISALGRATISVFGLRQQPLFLSLTEGCKAVSQVDNGPSEYQPSMCTFYTRDAAQTLLRFKKVGCQQSPIGPFISGPTIEKNGVTMRGCKYYHYQDLNVDANWIINGEVRSVFSTTNIPPSGLLKELTAPNYQITDYTDFGTYQCQLRVLQGRFNSKTFRSEQIVVKKLPLPVFTDGPKLFSTSAFSSGLVSIDGCHYLSPIPVVVQTFYLKNGYNYTQVFNIREELGFPVQETFPPLRFQSPAYTDQGYYQCVLRVPGIVGSVDVVSEAVDVRFTDVAATRIELKFENRVLTSTLQNRSSNEFQKLTEEINAMVSNTLDKENNKSSKVDIRILNLRSGSLVANIELLRGDQTPVKKLQTCSPESLLEIRRSLKSVTNSLNVEVESADCCSAESFGDSEFQGEYRISETLIATEANISCPYRLSNTAGRRCIGNLRNGPHWNEPVLLPDCPAKYDTTNKLIELFKEKDCTKEVCPSALELSINLTNIVSSNTEIRIRQDIFFTQRIINTIIGRIYPNTSFSETLNITQNVLDVVGILIDVDERILVSSQFHTKSTDAILKNLDALALILGGKIINTNQSISIFGVNVGFKVVYESPNGIIITSHKDLSDGLQIVEIRNVNVTSLFNITSFQSTFTTPDFGFVNNNKTIIYSYSFRKSSLFQSKDKVAETLFSNVTRKQFVESTILAVTINNNNTKFLVNETVEMKFRKVPVNIGGDGIKLTLCSFWNFRAGEWSTDGCFKVQEKNGEVTCRCNHLTNFALLLDVSQTGESPLALQIVTWIGCGISLCGLLLTILIYIIFRKLLKKLAPKILLCLCFSLIALLVVFLAGIEQTEPKVGCQTIASLIQYFTLTTFMWMLVETYNLYRCFIKIFHTGSSQKTFLMIASLFAWGIPAIIVIITASVEPENLGNDQFCIIIGLSFYLGVLVPVALVLLINFVMMFFIMKSLVKQDNKAAKHLGKKTSNIRQFRTAFGVSTLLGLTWVFGLLAVGDLRIAFQWIFTVLNALQGLFIFIFYTWRNPDVKKELLNYWRRLRKTPKKMKSSDGEMNTLKTNKNGADSGKDGTLTSTVSTLGKSNIHSGSSGLDNLLNPTIKERERSHSNTSLFNDVENLINSTSSRKKSKEFTHGSYDNPEIGIDAPSISFHPEKNQDNQPIVGTQFKKSETVIDRSDPDSLDHSIDNFSYNEVQTLVEPPIQLEPEKDLLEFESLVTSFFIDAPAREEDVTKDAAKTAQNWNAKVQDSQNPNSENQAGDVNSMLTQKPSSDILTVDIGSIPTQNPSSEIIDRDENFKPAPNPNRGILADELKSKPAPNPNREILADELKSKPAPNQNRGILADELKSTPAPNPNRGILADELKSKPAPNPNRGILADDIKSTSKQNPNGEIIDKDENHTPVIRDQNSEVLADDMNITPHYNDETAPCFNDLTMSDDKSNNVQAWLPELEHTKVENKTVEKISNENKLTDLPITDSSNDISTEVDHSEAAPSKSGTENTGYKDVIVLEISRDKNDENQVEEEISFKLSTDSANLTEQKLNPAQKPIAEIKVKSISSKEDNTEPQKGIINSLFKKIDIKGGDQKMEPDSLPTVSDDAVDDQTDNFDYGMADVIESDFEVRISLILRLPSIKRATAKLLIEPEVKKNEACGDKGEEEAGKEQQKAREE